MRRLFVCHPTMGMTGPRVCSVLQGPTARPTWDHCPLTYFLSLERGCNLLTDLMRPIDNRTIRHAVFVDCLEYQATFSAHIFLSRFDRGAK